MTNWMLSVNLKAKDGVTSPFIITGTDTSKFLLEGLCIGLNTNFESPFCLSVVGGSIALSYDDMVSIISQWLVITKMHQI